MQVNEFEILHRQHQWNTFRNMLLRLNIFNVVFQISINDREMVINGNYEQRYVSYSYNVGLPDIFTLHLPVILFRIRENFDHCVGRWELHTASNSINYIGQ